MRYAPLALVSSFVLLVGTVSAASLSQEDSTWINAFADKLMANCTQRFDEAQQRVADKSGWIGERARDMLAAERRVNCGCLPTRIRVRATPAVVAALKQHKVDEGRAFMAEQAKACGAQGLRDSAGSNCLTTEQESAFEMIHGRKPAEGDTDPVPALTEANKRTCACYADAVSVLDDATIIGEAEAAYANFRERVKNPDLPRYVGKMDALLAGCRQRAGE